MIDPEKLALNLRNKIKKRNQFLIAKISGSQQSPGETKTLEDYFRFKDYLDPEENKNWFSASLNEVWNPKLWKD